jgi:Putative binding domain, N-terminal
MVELDRDDFNVSSMVHEGALMILDRCVPLPLVLTLAASLLAAACNKKETTTTTSPSCSFSVVQPTTTFGPEGGTGSVPVTVSAGTNCSWTATSSATFITFSTGSGTGSGTAAFTVAVNTGAERTSTLTIAGASVSITQRAAVAAPAPTLAAPTAKSPVSGQLVDPGRPTLVVNNAAVTGTPGTVTYRFEVSDLATFPVDPVRTFTQDGVAQGSGTTSWVVNRDLGKDVLWYWRARATNGTVTSPFSSVETFSTGIPCTFTLSMTSVTTSATGGSVTINVATTDACSWNAVSNDGFIVLTSPSSGSGNGSLTFSVAANTGAARTGSVTISGQTITVSQAAGTASSNNNVVASFQLFDPASQGGETTECRFRSTVSSATTCTLRSNSYTLGTTGIVSQSWSVEYTYDATKTFTGTDPTLSFTDTCGKATATDDGVSQPLKVTLTVTDSAGNTATATAGAGSQPALFVRLFNCGF